MVDETINIFIVEYSLNAFNQFVGFYFFRIRI